MARYLVRRWLRPTVEDLLGTSPPIPAEWKITTKEFREDIEWVVVVESETTVNPAVRQLLDELEARGIR